MRAIRRTSAVAMLGAALALATVAAGQERPGKATQPTPEEMAAMQERFQRLAQPGPEHRMLARMAGVWKQEIRMRPEPGAETTELDGIAEARLVLGGRFLELQGRMAGSDEIVGINYIGFDRRSGRYNVVGMDIWGTYWVTASGAPAREGGPIVMSGTDHDPEVGTQVYDFVLRWIDEDTYVWEIIFKDDFHTRGTGTPFKMVEITYRRQK